MKTEVYKCYQYCKWCHRVVLTLVVVGALLGLVIDGHGLEVLGTGVVLERGGRLCYSDGLSAARFRLQNQKNSL